LLGSLKCYLQAVSTKPFRRCRFAFDGLGIFVLFLTCHRKRFQRQQGQLAYFCEAVKLPKNNRFIAPLMEMNKAIGIIEREVRQQYFVFDLNCFCQIMAAETTLSSWAEKVLRVPVQCFLHTR
jgi:hypothetical protein